MEKTLLIGDHLFVNKTAYVPRMPNTPISFPFTQNTMPLSKGKSWSDFIHWPYFPQNRSYKWNLNNFGPLWIPRKGFTINIDSSNICLWERIIDVYENNDLRIDGDKVFINNKQITNYTFKMDYYWMMGENRHGSSDSRYCGFVPEDHIVGKAKFIWLSLNKEEDGLNKIRLNRFFLKVKV